jgi:SAM-dependent methyltransferase
MTDAVPWRCPDCRGGLDPGPDRWSCLGCGRRFRALRGIPDLRTRDDLYLANADDWAFAARLDAEFDRLDFLGLLGRYFDLDPEIRPDQRRRQTAHILTAPGRVAHWLDALGRAPSGTVVDLGCGSGSFLAAVGRRVGPACGVDIAMRWLLVARKRLDEEGLGHVPLACACAEDLPLPDGFAGAVVAGDVIEHVGDQAATLREIHRVLSPRGRVFLASPNRFSLAPEPHVGVWGVGYLPRRWMAGYVRLVRGIDFRAVRTLGCREWSRLLASSPFGRGTLTVPPLPRDDLDAFGPLKRLAARCYNAAVATRPGQRVGRVVGPLFHVVCEKGAGPPPPASRATRRRSRPSAARG